MAVGLRVPDELVVLFEWQNGTDRSEPGPRIPLPALLPSLERCIANYEAELAVRPRESLGWVLIDYQYPGFMVSCRESPDTPPLLVYVDEDNPPDDERELPRLRSICTLITAWIVLIKSGALSWADSGWKLETSRVPAQLRRIGIPSFLFSGFDWR